MFSKLRLDERLGTWTFRLHCNSSTPGAPGYTTGTKLSQAAVPRLLRHQAAVHSQSFDSPGIKPFPAVLQLTTLGSSTALHMLFSKSCSPSTAQPPPPAVPPLCRLIRRRVLPGMRTCITDCISAKPRAVAEARRLQLEAVVLIRHSAAPALHQDQLSSGTRALRDLAVHS